MTQFRPLLFSFRCVGNFNNFCEFPLLSFFAWSLFGVASLLVTVQFLLVEYWSYFYHLDYEVNFIKKNVHCPHESISHDLSNKIL